MFYYSDKPIDDIKDDLLKRGVFSAQLAKAILSYSDKDNLTISLCGKWGSGKTSILNMVVKYIDEDQTMNQADKPIIIHFNPWNYSDRSQLITQFFQVIISKIDSVPNENTRLKIAKALKNYALIFEYTEYIPAVGKILKPLLGLAKGIGEQLSELYESKNSLENQKEQVVNALEAITQKFLIIIDDIDRLNNKQIKLIFQLVNSIAGFPNMIYLLSFDREIVVRALSEEQNCDGNEYLEKIIQVPFEVPEPNFSLIQNIFITKIKNIFKEVPFNENEYFYNIFQNCISPFITSIRDANRIINVFNFKYDYLKDEVNGIDLLAITTLQICAPDLFKWIYLNKEYITGSCDDRDRYGYLFTTQNDSDESIKKELSEIYGGDSELMLLAVQALFPQIASRTNGEVINFDTEEELRRKQKIACPERFPIYFNLLLDEIILPNRKIKDIVNNYNKEELRDFFSQITDDNKLSEFVKELAAYAPDMSEQRSSIFLEILFEIQAKMTKQETFNFALYECQKCCLSICKSMGAEQTKKELIALIKKSDLHMFSILMGFILEIECFYGRIRVGSPSNYSIIEKNHLEEIEGIIKQKLESLANESNPLDACAIWNIYYIWAFLDQESMNYYLKEAIKCAENVPKYLILKVNVWGGKEQSWSFNKESFPEYIDLEDIYNKILSLKNTDKFYKLDFKTKEVAITFYLWYNAGRNEKKPIKKHQVDELIPEWEKERR